MAHVGDWLFRRELLSPDKVALVDKVGGRGPITFRQWNRSTNRTARLLRERLGVEKGDRVAALAKNRVELLDLWFACGKLGAIFVPLNWRLSGRELAGMVKDAGPRVLAYSADFKDAAAALRGQVEGARFVSLDAPAEGDVPLAEREALADAAIRAEAVSWEDPWVLCYTGGTTGTSKAAVLTYAAITANAANTVTGWGLTPDDVALLNAPMFHTGGMNVFTAPLVYLGGTSVVSQAFDADEVFDLVEKRAITLFFGVPTMFITLQQHPRWEKVDFSKLKLVISGGAPCPQPVFDAFWARGVDFKTGYGLTEAGPNNFWLPPADVRRKPGSVGFPLFHVELQLRRDDGTQCGPEEVGELWISGPHVCAGYWRKPEESGRAIVDGWLKTGDLARFDAEGYWYIAGRAKDLIISGGENIYPAEVESVLAGHPDVAEVAVIGVPDAKWGEVPRAVVVARPGAAPTAEGLLEYCGPRLARYKTPRSFAFVDALPKTAAGKVDKRQLAKQGS
jgi:fatty-acyl-CoA synthase